MKKKVAVATIVVMVVLGLLLILTKPPDKTPEQAFEPSGVPVAEEALADPDSEELTEEGTAAEAYPTDTAPPEEEGQPEGWPEQQEPLPEEYATPEFVEIPPEEEPVIEEEMDLALAAGEEADMPPDQTEEEEVVAALSKEQIQEVITDQFKPLARECYQSLLDQFPQAEGGVTVSFQIVREGGRGRVDLSEVKNDGTTLMDGPMQDCLTQKLGDLEFDVPKGEESVNVTYPLNFNQDEEGE